jgi:hypothetical protein
VRATLAIPEARHPHPANSHVVLIVAYENIEDFCQSVGSSARSISTTWIEGSCRKLAGAQSALLSIIPHPGRLVPVSAPKANYPNDDSFAFGFETSAWLFKVDA